MKKNRNVKAFAAYFVMTSLSMGLVTGLVMVSGCDALMGKKNEVTEEKKATEPAPPVATPATATETAAAPGNAANASTPPSTPDLTPDADGLSKAIVVMETTKGTIEYKFYPKDAPKTVKRMVELIQKGFYNGLTFHRVVPGFVIQGGDPEGTGMGGSGQKLSAEFNSRKHVLGSVAMARSQDPNSADSQFYIALAEIPHLDGSYTVYGKVISGLDVVQKIAMGDKMTKVTLK